MKSITRSNLEKLNIDALIKTALEEFNVEIKPDSMEKKHIIGYLLALEDLRQSGVVVEPALDEKPKTVEEVIKNAREEAAEIQRQISERRVEVTFHSSNEPGGQLPIKMSLNGRAYVVKREEKVALPESVFRACIENAIQTIYEPIEDPVTRKTTTVARDAHRFPYTFHGYVEARAA